MVETLHNNAAHNLPGSKGINMSKYITAVIFGVLVGAIFGWFLGNFTGITAGTEAVAGMMPL